MSAYYIGADLGGTGIKAALVDEYGAILARSGTATPVAEGADGILRALKEVIRGLLQDGREVRGIGIGTAGRVDPEQGVVLYATDNLPGWSGMQLAAAIAAEFGLPAAADNDANAAALGEGWLGAAAGFKHYAMLTLGTGVGGSVVYKGMPVAGSRGGAGEFGHMVLHPGGLPCSCGQRGCAEHYVSGRALARLAAEAEPSWDGRRLLAEFAEGHPAAAGAMDKYLADLSDLVHNIQSCLDPEAIVLGGGVAESHPLWWGAWLERLAVRSPLPVTVLPARLGNEAGMIGAARIMMLREEA